LNPEEEPSMRKPSKPCSGHALIMQHPGLLKLLNKKRHYASTVL